MLKRLQAEYMQASQAVGETACQLPRVQTVYGCNVTVIAIFHSTV